MRIRRDDGVTLAVETHGSAVGPCLVFAHGFGQTRGSWRNSARKLASQGWRCIVFDMRGHGESDHVAEGHYPLEDFVEDLAAVCFRQPQPRIMIGASMGGLLALVAAAECSQRLFDALVLVDITPRWQAEGVQRMLGFMRAFPDGFVDYDEAATRIAEHMPHRRQHKSEEQLRPLLRRSADQRLRWHWDPAMLETVVRQGERCQPRLLQAARQIDLPVLLLSGACSDVVSQANVDEFLQLVPHARHVELAGATHMLAGDDNDAFTREIASFANAVVAPVAASSF